MENKGNYLDQLKQKLMPFLRDYLVEHNVEIVSSGQFRCINPDHEDARPSMGFVNGTKDQVFNCFSCGSKGTIIDAAHFIEGKPTSGKEFIYETLFYLADKYAIPYNESFEITEEELYERQVFKAYKEAADIISENQPIEYLKKRNWPVSLCRDHQIGWIEDYREFMKKMVNRGFNRQFLEDVDFSSQLFNPSMLIFSVKDEKGRVVGFAGRDMEYENKSGSFKFRNTSSKCPIYSKSKILFGLHIGKKHTPPLYIFEGYPDWVTAQKYGLENSCAIGGTALTYEHINLLKELGIKEIVLCLDGDKSGQDKTEKLLDEHFSGEESFRIHIVKLPDDKDQCDPDDFLDKNKLEDFQKLPRMDAFEWRLSRFSYDFDKENVCDLMIPLILNEPNNIKRETMCKTLSEFAGVRLKAIQRQLDTILNYEEAHIKEKENATVRQVMNEIKEKDGDPVVIFEVAAESLKRLRSATSDDLHSEGELISYLYEVKDKFETREPGLLGFETGWEMFDDAFSGIPKEDVMITFAGDANTGKTGLMFNLAYRLAKNNDDVLVLFMSIDDSRQQALPRLVAIAAGLEIRQVTHPSEHLSTDEDKKKLEAGWKEIMSFIDDKKFSIKDVSQGTTLNFAESWIRWNQDKYPDRRVIFFLDNFHKLSDEYHKDERVRFKHASARIHQMKNKLHISAICTMETRKFIGTSNSKRPQLADIAESKQMEFDNNMIGMIYNDMHARRQGADVVWMEEKGGQLVKKPIVEVDIQKNKITDFKGTLFYKFSPEHSVFYECKEDDVDESRGTYKRALKHVQDRRDPSPQSALFASSKEVSEW